MDTWLTGPQVAEQLGVDRVTVQRIPRDVLPYEQTPGGSVRSGRRRYKQADIEAYRSNLTGGGDRMDLLEKELRELRKRVERQEKILTQWSEVLDRIALLERAVVRVQSRELT